MPGEDGKESADLQGASCFGTTWGWHTLPRHPLHCGQSLSSTSVIFDTWCDLFSLCRALENEGFEIVERGEIEVKGKGKMTTYFLIRNLHASEDEIMGRPHSRLDRKGEQKREAASQCQIFFPLTTSDVFSGALGHVGSAWVIPLHDFLWVEAPKDQSNQDEHLHPG